ncbi:atypical chemokine receptor 2-like [Carassius carassius]|uniref:atypical chemokine receptor 2-like n=1 Tax=Carassius carassius TaxID=217509 RepID=UPI002868E36B|nr:atypical chemokine receptor 2-like [Carassius carassius]
MDVSDPEDSSYEDYYNSEGLEEIGICKKTHVKDFSRVFLPVLYSITCVLSIIANFTLLTLFIKYKTLRKVLPLHMVISDILFTLSLPFWAVYASSEWIFGDQSCKAVSLVYMVSLYSSNLFVASQSLERFMDLACVVSTTSIFKSPKRNTIMCSLVWLFSVLGAAVHVSFVETQKSHDQYICTYHFNDKDGWKIYTRFQMNILGFVVPFLVLLFCSVRLPCVAEVRSTFKVFRHEAGFTIMFFLLWFPYSVVIFLYALQDLHVFYACTTNIHFDFAIHVTECIAFMHVFTNPVLYISLNKKVWRRLRNACKTPREYLLEKSNSSSVMLSQHGAIELKAVQQYQAHDLSVSAERPNNFLPELM